MLIIHTVAEAIGLMVAGIFLLGTWPVVWHQVECAGRLPSHVFLDYALTYLVCASTAALTLGQLGPYVTSASSSPPGASLQFLDQLQQHNWPLVLFALAGGTCLALGDLALQYSISLCGLGIGPPVLNAVTLIVGVVLSYFLDGGINKPQLVFTGAAFAAVAIGLGGAAHIITHQAAAATAAGSAGGACATSSTAGSSSCHSKDSSEDVGSDGGTGQGAAPWKASCHCHCWGRRRLPVCTCDDTAHCGLRHSRGIKPEQGSSSGNSRRAQRTGCCTGPADAVIDMDTCTASGDDARPQQGQATHIMAQQQQILEDSGQDRRQPIATDGHKLAASNSTVGRSIGNEQQQQQQRRASSLVLAGAAAVRRRPGRFLGLAVAIIGGVVYGCFMPAFQIAANDPFKLLPPASAAAPLSVYTTYFYFAVAFSSVSLLVNAWLLYRPALGGAPSSIPAYLSDHRGRVLSVLSGFLAASGDLTQFMGGQTAGYAAAMLVMAYPVVGVLWGFVLRCSEQRRTKRSLPEQGVWTGGHRAPPLGVVLVVGQVVSYVVGVGLLAGSAELRSH